MKYLLLREKKKLYFYKVLSCGKRVAGSPKRARREVKFEKKKEKFPRYYAKPLATVRDKIQIYNCTALVILMASAGWPPHDVCVRTFLSFLRIIQARIYVCIFYDSHELWFDKIEEKTIIFFQKLMYIIPFR